MSENGASRRAAEGDHGHDGHNHGAALLRAGAQHQRALTAAFALTAGFLVVEVVAGFAFGSLALLSDAAHMFTDVLGIGMALAAIQVASREASRHNPQHTFGFYRLEILAAFVNALLLFAVAIYVVIESIRRLLGEPEVPDGSMLAVALGGLAVNVVAFAWLRAGASESMNVEGAYLEVLADMVGSVGVIIGALVMAATGWHWVDPLVAALIGLWILPRTFRLGRRAVRVLLQAAPADIDMDELHRDLVGIESVVDVHDLHVWTLTSGMDALSAHITAGPDADSQVVLGRARTVLGDRYGITHSTLQLEPPDHVGCPDLDW